MSKSEISGEFLVKNPPNKEEPEMPKVIAEGSVEVEVPKLAKSGQEAEVVDIDKLTSDLADLDDEITKAYTQIRTYQSFAKKYAGKEDILAKLNEESKQFQIKYDRLQAKRDQLAGRLRQNQ